MKSSNTKIEICPCLFGNYNVVFGDFRNPGDGQWDVTKSCQWIKDHEVGCGKVRRGCGSGWCARHVRCAMEAGGMSTNGRPNWAWKYVDYLPQKGFEHIYDLKRGDTSFTPRTGDIACYQQNNNPKVAGHICMYVGGNINKWVSDFIQNSVFVYNSTNVAHIFRYRGKTIS